MIKMDALEEGDLIDIIAPAGRSNSKQLELAKSYLISKGFRVNAPMSMIKNHMHFANTEVKRFEFLKKALQSPESKAIWCLRGGSGSQQLFPYLDRLKKPKKTKLLIGLSDISSLHYYLNTKWKWPSLHAPVMSRMGAKHQSKKEEKEIWQSLMAEKKENIYSKLKPMNKTARNRKTVISGEVTGGNLITLQALLGGKLKFQAKQKILFLEDISEQPYRIDRAFTSMLQAGVFDSCRAIIFGDFTDCRGVGKSPSLEEELAFFANKLNIPVYSGLKSGHGRLQRPLWLGTKAKIEKKELIVSSPFK